MRHSRSRPGARALWLGLPVLAAMLTQSPAARAAAVPVQAQKAARQDVPVMLHNIGTVQAYDSVLVRARVDGTIDKLFFTDGQDVKAGQPLAQIDPRPYAAAYAQAVAKKSADEAALANAQQDLARYSSLAKSDFASHQQVDTQRALVRGLQATLQGDAAQIASAQLNLDYAHVTSPISGRIGIRMVDPGNLVQASQATGIVTVTQIHPIFVIFTLPQDDLPQIQAGMARGKLPVTAFASDNQTVLDEGTLLTIDNQIDQATGTIKLKATFPNPDDKLWPGQFVNVRMQTNTLHQALVIPSAAVQNGPDGQFVYVVKPDSTVAQQPVQITMDTGTVAVVAKGLTDGATVVTHGQQRLQAGMRVAISAPPAGQAAVQDAGG